MVAVGVMAMTVERAFPFDVVSVEAVGVIALTIVGVAFALEVIGTEDAVVIAVGMELVQNYFLHYFQQFC